MAQPQLMKQPHRPANCPIGLEYLTLIDTLLVHQEKHLIEIFTGYETCNKYIIQNSFGEQIYYAMEDSDCISRNCFGYLRPFETQILDNFFTEVLHFYRPLRCDDCCFPCCLQKLQVESPPGTIIGTVEQNWNIIYPQYTVKNDLGEKIFKIDGPLCTCSICGRNVEFRVMTEDGKIQVGMISKQWSGILTEAFTDADYFGITFPMDLDVKMKATLLGACFLIDMMYFENC